MESVFLFYIIFHAILNAVPTKTASIISNEPQKWHKNYTKIIKNGISRDFEDNIDTMAEGSNNPNDNGTLLDAFHKYVNHYGGGSYAPYATVGGYPPPYPHPPVAPINYGTVPVPVAVPVPAAVYPSPPYAVQTAFQGYLPTATPASETTSTTTAATTTSSSPLLTLLSALNPLTFFTITLPTIMMSTIFRVLAGIVMFIGMFIFSGGLGDLICNFTPLCNMITNSLSRGINSDTFITSPAKPREEFVRSSIRRYRDLQKSNYGKTYFK